MNISNGLSIQYANHLAGLNVKDGINLNTLQPKESNTGRYDKVEISLEASADSPSLNVGELEVISEVMPRNVGMERAIAFNELLQQTFDKLDRMSLSFFESQEFINNEVYQWVDGLRQSDPEMYQYWVKNNKDDIASGRPDLASLPSDFTMEDYAYYVSDEFF